MSRWFTVEREAAAALWGAKRLWGLHAGANLALAALVYAWLSIPDARLWQVAASLLLGVVLALAFLWLHGSTLEFFTQAHTQGSASVRAAFRATLRRLPALVLWALLFGLALWAVSWAGATIWYVADWLGSALTLAARRPVSPQSVGKFLTALLWVLTWVWVPLLLLPLAAQTCKEGFGGFRTHSFGVVWSVFRRGRYWIGYLVLLVVGTWPPVLLINWIPKVESLWGQAASLAVRFLGAYLLLLTAWLLLGSLLGRLRTASD